MIMYNRYVPGHNGIYERITVDEPKSADPTPPYCGETSNNLKTETAQHQKVSRRKSRIDFDLGDMLLLCVVVLLAIDADEEDVFPLLVLAAAFLMQ